MLINTQNSLAIMVDIQEKLTPSIQMHEELIKNCEILIDGLKLFEIPIIANEQYPQGLGSTIEGLKEKLSEVEFIEKTNFSCCANEQTKTKILKSKKNIAIVFGIEAHICVMQTCLDLLNKDICPVLVVDCIGSRKELDKQIAIQRMIQAGVVPITYEALLFELCKDSKNPLFKDLSKLVK